MSVGEVAVFSFQKADVKSLWPSTFRLLLLSSAAMPKPLDWVMALAGF